VRRGTQDRKTTAVLVALAAMIAVGTAGGAQQGQPPLQTPPASPVADEAPDVTSPASAPEVPPVRRARPRAREETSLELAGAKIQVMWAPLPPKGSDFAAVDELDTGAVVRFAGAAAVKLLTSADLLFGDLRVARGNAAEDYPGVYALWIERCDDGWRLIFNEQADVWGTQHHPAADVGGVALEHQLGESGEGSFDVELVAEDGGKGLLVLSWGPHRWSAPFSVSPPKGSDEPGESRRAP